MKIDPKQIAKMITEDPNEVVPSDHFDDTEDEYMDEDPYAEYQCEYCYEPAHTRDEYGAATGAVCDECEAHYCELCEGHESFERYDSHFHSSPSVLMGCPMCDG